MGEGIFLANVFTMLEPGTRLGHYEVVTSIGIGGMGEVYKARDTRLDRTVAIKVIHGLVASDTALRERFQREARAVSSLNHPHICTLHDVGSEGEVDFLVMEHLEGESLADRLKRDALSFEEALRYGIQIADALDAAHHQGIVHRDLKPGNVMLTPSGAKLLDFGLAKTETADSGLGEEDSALPTAGKPLTEKGAVLGTFQYMAPEQLEGHEVDPRTDLFSFGALLYEMLTGRKAFAGGSQASLITAIMSSEPTPIASLQPMTPLAIDHIVGRCLKKDPESRWQTARDVKLELEWMRERPQDSETTAPRDTTDWRERLIWIFALLGAVAVTGLTVRSLTRAPDVASIRTSVQLPPGLELDDRGDSRPFAISPDGKRIVFCALGGGSESQLFVRSLDRFEATPLDGTENAINPLFSPDGEWVAFFADGKLLKVSVAGGAPIEIADAAFGSFGAAWLDDGTLVFDNAFARGGLMRVSSEGGEAEVFTTVDASSEATIAHERPVGLPGSHDVLLHVGNEQEWRAAVRPAETGTVRPIRGIPTSASLWGYMPSGHLIYSLSGSVWAVSFDLAELETIGAPMVVLDGIYSGGRFDYVAISDAGTLVYTVGETRLQGGSTMAWVDREGRVTPVRAEPGAYTGLRISPDGSQFVTSAYSDNWVFDVDRGTRSRLGIPFSASVSWSSDGRHLVFNAADGIYSSPVDGRTEPTLLLPIRTGTQFEAQWSPDEKHIVFYEMHPTTGRDIWMLPLDGEPVPLAATGASERSPRLSPNGRWLAYASDESGRDEVFVQAFPGPEGKQMISTNGGREPVWSRDGTELFYRRGDELLVVPVETGDELIAGTPTTLTTARFSVGAGGRNQNYDVSPDGKRFLFVQRDEGVPRELRVVLNWADELEDVLSQ